MGLSSVSIHGRILEVSDLGYYKPCITAAQMHENRVQAEKLPTPAGV